MQIIYPDVLLVVNFCMDYIALYLCGVFVHTIKRKKLLFLSALLGGVYSVVCIFVSGNSLFNFVLNVSVSLLLCYITYGKDVKGLIQMPFSRHWIMHIEACLRIKDKLLPNQ